MKYIVMECHDSYSVLMDEESRFVMAANINYEVGQTVTNPIIMNNKEVEARNIKLFITKAAAAAACFILIAGAGYRYYNHNFTSHSTIVLSSQANITMELNRKGEVISLKSNNDEGNDLLKDYNGKGKDKVTVTNEILELELSKGYISDGDTVELFIASKNSDVFDDYKTTFENKMSDLKVKINVHDMAAKAAEPPKPNETVSSENKKDEVKPNPPVPEKEADKKEEPLKPDDKGVKDTPAPAVEKEKEKPNADIHEEPPVPPAPHDELLKPPAEEPPKPDEVKPTAPEPEAPAPPAPEKPADAPEPPAPDPAHKEREIKVKPHERLPEPAHSIQDPNSIDIVLPELN